MPQRLRMFISSPGDVPDERLRADLVVDKLNQEYSRYFQLGTYRWEHEPMLAAGHFQDAVQVPSEFDIVILILWSRLGTPLPDRTATRDYRGIDGRAPVTGTEWEFEEALSAARERGAPDILAFRNMSPAPIETHDMEMQARGMAQLNALNGFWTRHFADRGVFLAAYTSYRTLEEFADRLEQSLRKLIERRIRSMDAFHQAQAEAIWLGDPFRGLEAYDFEHAQIFYGRDASVRKAIEQLVQQARNGSSFLLVSGASGSGKSSLVKAAVLPRLMKPQRIEGAAFLRRLSVRPSDLGGDLVLGLVEALTRGTQAEGVGLPELLGPAQRAADLAQHLRTSPEAIGFVFSGALGRVTDAARRAGLVLAHEDAKLILVIDQLEELFTIPTISLDERRLFIRLLDGLARQGMVWTIATVRADFWHRVAELPELVTLCEGQGRLDVGAPTAAELADIVRRPAQAAGLAFERNADVGVRLDALLVEHAEAAPGVLPLLSFTLEALYAEDVSRRGGRLLTHATYQALGGLEGAIATRADEVVVSLPPEAQAALPLVLRALTTVSTGSEQVTVARAAPLDSFAVGSPARSLIDALTAARLLVASSEGAVPTVRLAHEALIRRWGRAREQLEADRRDLETRVLIERQDKRWRTSTGAAQQQLLLRDPDLANATDLVRRWGDELPAALRDFISRSAGAARAAARRRWAIAGAVMAGLAALATASFAAFYIAEIQRNEALIAQSRFLARDAQAAVASGDATRGVLLSLAALPRSLADPDRPFVKQAAYALEDALANRREHAILQGHAGTVWSVAFSPDGTKVVTSADDGIARIWTVATGAETAALSGHTARIWAAAFSPDGKRVATASDDGTARLWEIGGGAGAVLRGHADGVTSIAFSPDGQQVATGSEDKTARLWNARTGALLATLPHDGLVNHVAFSPDGRRLLTASTDNSARLWDLATGTAVLVLKGHKGFVQSASFSADGSRVVTASWDESARVWDANTGAVLAVLQGHDGWVVDASFSRDGTHIVTASTDKTARLWNAATGVLTRALIGHESPLSNAVFSPDGRRVVTSSQDHSARLWDSRSGVAVGKLRGHGGVVEAALFSPDGLQIATASSEGTARLWTAEIGAASAVLRGHDDIISAIAFSPDGKSIATGSNDRTVRLWAPQSGDTHVTMLGHDNFVRAVAFARDGSRLISGSDDGTARIWDVATHAELAVLRGPGRIWAVAISPDGKRIATGSEDGTARLWDMATRTEVLVLRHASLVNSVVFSPDGKQVATSSWDKSARVWDAETGAPLAAFADHDGRVSSIAFSPDGKRLVTGSDDKTARVWDLSTGKTIAILTGHESWLYAARFTPDGKRIVTVARDNSVRLWDAATGAPILELRGHGDAVRAVDIAPDGLRLATASADTTVRLWLLPARCQDLIDVALKTRTRDQTQEERQRFFLEGRPTGAATMLWLSRWFAPILPHAGDQCE